MLAHSFGAADLDEFVRQKHVGERVNPHVVVQVRTPSPDFGAMQRAIEGKPRISEGTELNDSREERAVPKDK